MISSSVRRRRRPRTLYEENVKNMTKTPTPVPAHVGAKRRDMI